MDLFEEFIATTKESQEYKEAIDILKKNSSGKIWLIGGFLYRTLGSQIYDIPKPEVDLDFIVEQPVKEFDLPKGWTVGENKFGNPKFINGKKSIDYVPLSSINALQRRKVKPTIENYLGYVPLTIQAMALDVYEEKVIGNVGITALFRKIVQVNNAYDAAYAAQKKNCTVQEMIQKKADSLGFRAVV